MKKIFKILGITLLLVIGLLVAIPFILESKIDSIVQNYVDENVNAKVSFDDVSLSLISSFPQANVSIDNLNIVTLAPFEDETLASAKRISFDMPIKELFKSDGEPLVVNDISINELLLAIQTKANDAVNYDILKESDSESANTFSFDVKNYDIENSAFTYFDESTQTIIYVTDINHNGKGIFSEGISQMETTTEAKMSLAIDSTDYLKDHSIKLDALIDLDLEQDKYTFKENEGFINDLPLQFEGFVQLVEEGQEIDISFKNPASDFKDFLAIIPETYRKNLENITTTGEFVVNGKIKGLVSDETIPTLDINMVSNNASFKYPDLPKSVSDISINASVKNTTGYTKDTYVDINTFNFRIDQDNFRSEAHIKNLTENMLVNAKVDGTLNLANLSKAYPIDLESELTGVLKANLTTRFDMDAIETNAYQRINTDGVASVSNVVFSSDALAKPMQISKADVTFNPQTVTLNNFIAKTGQSDISATGSIQNLFGFLFSDKDLQGNFNMNSNTFAVSDFMVNEDEEATENNSKSIESKSAIKIPAFLNCTINANANTVLYDNLTLKDVKGQLVLKDEAAYLNNLNSSLFEGQMALKGNVSTKTEVPTFNMELGINSFDVSKSFQDLELLQNLAPIAKILKGKLNSAISLKGTLSPDLSPQLNSVSGDALAELLTTSLDGKKGELLNGLASKLNFINLEELNLDNLKTSLSFENGEVSVKPFKFMYKDIPITVSGSHSFQNAIEYNVTLQVPAKYLGSEVNRLIGKINDEEVNNISIPVSANVSGTFSNPEITTDLSGGVKDLTAQLIEIQKQKLVGKGKDKIKDLLGGVITKTTDSTAQKNETPKDSSATKPNEKGVRDVLGNILKKAKKVKDTTGNQ
ncbi:AsmA-like C-terminal region-containing protein [Winogradskyella sp. A3E31]|uniref:AsmA-like C-terminal region-containing protein n=1 Tax=Winogradskyella sp. A3E31 TaxID=3349637 RepID=UPI00398AC709